MPILDDVDDPDCWAELVRRNPSLSGLFIKDTIWVDCASGLVSGACGHQSLGHFVCKMCNSDADLDEHVGAQFSRLFKETKPLQTFLISGFEIQRQGAELMAECICENKTLQDCVISLSVYTVLLESFLVNQTAVTFRIDNDSCDIKGSDAEKQAFCQSLSHVFIVNKSLQSFRLPPMEINSENGLMDILVGGLSANKTLKTINLLDCDIDQAALTCLEHALMETMGSVASPTTTVVLPYRTRKVDINSFLRNLVHMPRIREVSIQGSLDADEKKLLLQTVKETKTLFSVKRDMWNHDPVDAQIDFYLKLNRLGRRIVECPNVNTSCWPLLLSRMTRSEPNHDPAALFYFVRAYFANNQHQHAGPTNVQQQRQEQPHTDEESLQTSPLGVKWLHITVSPLGETVL
jgi:hypothetical protein